MADEVVTTPAQTTTSAADVKATETTKTTTPAADAKGASAESTTAAPATETSTESATPAQVPVVPEKYELKLAKESVLDAAYVSKLEAEAKAEGLSNEQAQARLTRDESLKGAFVQEQKELIATKVKAWVQECEADKEIGGKDFKQNVELAKRALNRFADDKFKVDLEKTGLGNNPDLLRVFLRVGKMMSEDQLVEGKSFTPKATSTRESRLYPTMNKKQE